MLVYLWQKFENFESFCSLNYLTKFQLFNQNTINKKQYHRYYFLTPQPVLILWLVSHINLFYKLHGLNLFDQIEKSWNLHQQITPSVSGNKLLLLTKKWKKKHTNHPDNYVFQIFDPPYQVYVEVLTSQQKVAFSHQNMFPRLKHSDEEWFIS